jgi:CheY-like chemotaxis protein
MELKQKVLVVDDERCLRKFFKTLLEVDGYHVDTVSSGREAIARINEGERPDFILLDILMPEMGGLETLQELMRLNRSLNVIIESCSNELATIAEAFRLGARDYLTLPFEKAELDAMLRAKRIKQDSDENLPSPHQLALASSEWCSTPTDPPWSEPPWSTRVVYRKPSSNGWVMEFLSPERPRCFCDASRQDWGTIVREWKDQKRLYLWLCEQHAAFCGFF